MHTLGQGVGARLLRTNFRMKRMRYPWHQGSHIGGLHGRPAPDAQSGRRITVRADVKGHSRFFQPLGHGFRKGLAIFDAGIVECQADGCG